MCVWVVNLFIYYVIEKSIDPNSGPTFGEEFDTSYGFLQVRPMTSISFFPKRDEAGGKETGWNSTLLSSSDTTSFTFLVRLTVFYSFSLDLPCTMKSSTFLAGGKLIQKRRMGLHPFCQSPRMVSTTTEASTNDSNFEKHLIFFQCDFFKSRSDRHAQQIAWIDQRRQLRLWIHGCKFKNRPLWTCYTEVVFICVVRCPNALLFSFILLFVDLGDALLSNAGGGKRANSFITHCLRIFRQFPQTGVFTLIIGIIAFCRHVSLDLRK